MDVKIMIKLGSNDNDPIRMKRVDQIQNKKIMIKFGSNNVGSNQTTKILINSAEQVMINK